MPVGHIIHGLINTIWSVKGRKDPCVDQIQSNHVVHVGCLPFSAAFCLSSSLGLKQNRMTSEKLDSLVAAGKTDGPSFSELWASGYGRKNARVLVNVPLKGLY